jgi:hypothetical protein
MLTVSPTTYATLPPGADIVVDGRRWQVQTIDPGGLRVEGMIRRYHDGHCRSRTHPSVKRVFRVSDEGPIAVRQINLDHIESGMYVLRQGSIWTVSSVSSTGDVQFEEMKIGRGGTWMAHDSARIYRVLPDQSDVDILSTDVYRGNNGP